MIDKTREIILKTLYKVQEENSYSNLVLDEKIKENRKNLTDKDVGFISEIVYGTVTWRLTIDEIIKKYSSVRIKKISPWILNILRMGIYQIVFLDKVPKSAAVNESVNLAKRYGHRSSSNFVNAVLRKVEKIDYLEMNDIQEFKERISKMYSMPEWIIEELQKDNSNESIEEICKATNIRPKLCIRVNNLKIEIDELIQKLEAKNIVVEKGIIEPFLVLDKIKNIENLKEFKDGLFTIQDEAAGLIPILLNPKHGEKVLDACSAPGGKTTFMAEIMGNSGEITAFDVYDHRLELVKQNAKRLGIDIIETLKQDGSIYEEKYKEKFDKILLDVPCLGLGVMKRKPDIKWQKKKEDIENISKLQYVILENCSKYLKKEGEIVYSTCSIISSENKDVINKFLVNNKEFSIIDLKYQKNDFFDKFKDNIGGIQVLPNEKTDGFYILKLKKNT